MSHHPSCDPEDRDLVWHCNQCGLNEDAEVEILDAHKSELAQAQAEIETVKGMLGQALKREDKMEAALDEAQARAGYERIQKFLEGAPQSSWIDTVLDICRESLVSEYGKKGVEGK
jgi:hypothetical protein